ncbi:hypothetical protein [Cohnella herbarum]|uniref:Uncharacterized protein n=1 Tax=Cohnella herbarum TaxID=2728023 RepID=A0A7Z2VJL4_9BACL|nr:hypothetical protein [Cohnella herbarum]QJD84267.1 hypothetical protein HH215_14425 [Cohnella herbarum]
MDDSHYFDESALQPLIGRAVFVILVDGTRHTGILTSCSPTALVLNGERTARPVNRKRKSKSKLQAEVSTLNEDEQPAFPASSAYWGNLGISPAIEISPIKAVIPLYPIREIIPL